MTDRIPDRPTWIEEALDAHEAPLLRYAYRLLGDAERARDLVQEAFLRLCRADPAKVGANLGAWLHTVCRNLALDQYRKEMRMNAIASGAALAPQPPPDPALAAERADQRSDLQLALASLSESQRSVVQLRFQAGLSYKEISQVTGQSVSHVGVLLHTAIRRIRDQIADGLDLSPVRSTQ